jgi:hypothetical protein
LCVTRKKNHIQSGKKEKKIKKIRFTDQYIDPLMEEREGDEGEQ